MSTLSRRSRNSIAADKRRSKHVVTDDELFEYVLRIALLSYLVLPKTVEQSVTASPEVKEKNNTSRLSAVSNSLFNFGDLVKDLSSRDGSKSAKYPERMIKELKKRLEAIGMARDPAYSDQLIRRSMTRFFGQLCDDSYMRQIKDSRQIEALILNFAKHATDVLKKEPSLGEDGWKYEFNNQIAMFVRLLRECLTTVGHTPPELNSRLDMYEAKLKPSTAPSDSGYDSASTTAKDKRDSTTNNGISGNIADMTLVLVVARLFKLPEHAVQGEVDAMRKKCTEKAALQDLKTCLKNINAGAPFPGRREDFSSDAAWTAWKTLETTHLSQLMVTMVQFNPELAKSTPADVLPSSSPAVNNRPGSIYSIRHVNADTPSHRTSISSRRSYYSGGIPEPDPDGITQELAEDDEVTVGHNFTYIPPNPKKYYKRLVEYCLTVDLERMMSPEVDDSDEVSLGILSLPHIELINECALRWRIGQPYRATCFLDLVKQFYERQEVPMECIPEALSTLQKVVAEVELDKWPIADIEYCASVYNGLFQTFLGSLYHSMDNIPNLKPAEVQPYIVVLEHVRDSGLLESQDLDISARMIDVQERIRAVAEQFYHMKLQELRSAPGVNRALPLLFLSDEIEKAAKQMDKRFPEPILGTLDLVSPIVEVHVPMFLGDLETDRKRLFESSMNGPTPDVPIQDVFSLYRRSKILMGMLEDIAPHIRVDFDLGSFFEPYVRQWLVNTDNKTAEWVQAAIKADKFEAEDASGHSTSIIDLFDSLRSPINFLQELEWSDPYQGARFATSLSKTISKAVEQYCRSVEELFMAEMYPRPAEYLQPQKSSAWLEKARQLAIQGEKKIEPFNFQPQSCVKLNNIESARRLLDSMYDQMQADKVAEVLEMHGPPVPEKVERPRFLFTVKVAIAEGLVPLDSSPSSKLDTFVTLSDEAGNRLAKTRTIYETLSPRWDETFDISVDKPLWLMISVRDRALVGKHDTVGRAYLCLDPRRFGDFLAHDLWFDLDSQGRILLRVSMEGEKDDIQFYFGRAFRSLKRAETDMVRIFIDKMSPFIQQSISRSVLKTLMKTGNAGLDYNKALGNLKGLYSSAIGASASEVQIPLPKEEKPRIRPEELTDVEIERAIIPLFDYFDSNLQTLNTYLSESAKDMVMARVWKEILTVVESLLIPPLSDKNSEMKPLSDKEVDIVFKWLKFLRDYFYADGEGPMPLENLQNQKYRDVYSIRLYYDWHTDDLMEECVRMMQQTLRAAPSVKKRAKSVLHQRNLGTIKSRKKEKQKEKEGANGETILRILRMRNGTEEFIAQQLQIMAAMQADQEARAQQTERRKQLNRIAEVSEAPPSIPEVPPLPPK